MNPYLAEFLGTLVLILMGDGVCLLYTSDAADDMQ